MDAYPRPKRRLGGTAIAVSLAAHLVILAMIGLYAPGLIYREPPPLKATNVWLMPRLTLNQHAPPQHQAVVQKTPLPAAAPAPTKAVVKPSPAPTSVPSPAPTAAGPGRSPAAGPKFGAPPVEVGPTGGTRDALRTSVGCDADPVVHLTPGERDKCNQKVGEMAKRSPAFNGIDPLKRGRFDDQATADERRRAARDGPLEEVMPACTGPGSNLGGACLPDSAIAHIHQH
jgi:hypothetical protein